MKNKPIIDIVLPIAISIFLPVFNLFSNSGLTQGNVVPDFYGFWLRTSIVLYGLWYVLLFSAKVKEWRWILSIVTSLVWFLIICGLFLMPVFQENPMLRWRFGVKYFFAAVNFLIIQYAMQANSNIAFLQLEKEKIQTENYKVQLQSFRTKVDPHFLFNSLNTLRTMVRNNNKQSEQFIMSLSNFYRQTMKYNNSPVVTLDEELDVLKSYIFLMQTRNEGAVEVTIAVENGIAKSSLPTLSLQIVVENCFKYNVMTQAQPLQIQISLVDAKYILVRNNLNPKLTKSEKSGYGLENIRTRYELLGIDDGIIVSKTAGFFEVKLKLI